MESIKDKIIYLMACVMVHWRVIVALLVIAYLLNGIWNISHPAISYTQMQQLRGFNPYPPIDTF